ncbi:hypothetical protein Fmac_018525 [Flemingia macrophylla]|uniref:Photosystem II CP47 chlorophyll apoprotein n=1 Tax=Flemingia macrophylla TaxID=520843 RepID=A0ABD1M577_9FABA
MLCPQRRLRGMMQMLLISSSKKGTDKDKGKDKGMIIKPSKKHQPSGFMKDTRKGVIPAPSEHDALTGAIPTASDEEQANSSFPRSLSLDQRIVQVVGASPETTSQVCTVVISSIALEDITIESVTPQQILRDSGARSVPTKKILGPAIFDAPLLRPIWPQAPWEVVLIATIGDTLPSVEQPILGSPKAPSMANVLPFRRAESKYSVEQVGVTVEFYGGELNGVSYSDPATFPRGWFTFGHASFALLFFFGHIWHGARTLFRDVFAGIDPDLDAQVEFGAFQKLGDPTTRRQMVEIEMKMSRSLGFSICPKAFFLGWKLEKLKALRWTWWPLGLRLTVIPHHRSASSHRSSLALTKLFELSASGSTQTSCLKSS